jgi:5-methylcytosine-specific restriction endonuclease McrA
MRTNTRQEVRERANNTCEYCKRPDWFASGPFVVEHIRPKAKGGEDDLGNLAYACSFCNGAKYDATEAIDPTTGHIAPLFHPRRDVWE